VTTTPSDRTPVGPAGSAERPSTDRFPPDFRIAIDPSVQRVNSGKTLVGGSPLRLLRLTEAGARLVNSLRGGSPVPSDNPAHQLVRRLLSAGMVHPRPGPAAHAGRAVALVIPVRDRATELEMTLDCLDSGEDVLVVDDGSHDASATYEIVHSRGAKLLRHKVTRGPAAARNTGWRKASTDFVAFVDQDCQPDPGWLDALLPHFNDPSVAAVAPRIRSRASVASPAWLAKYEDARSPLDCGKREGPVRPRSWVPYVPTTALVVRRVALEAVGGFDEALQVGEDVDLVWRLAAGGWTIRYEPTVAASHPTRDTFSGWLRQRFRYGTSAAPLARRHGTAVAPLDISTSSAASWLLLAFGYGWASVALTGLTTALFIRRLVGLGYPWRYAFCLAGTGHLRAGLSVGTAVRRTWWPLGLALALVSRRSRLGILSTVTLPLAGEWISRAPGIDIGRWVALRLLDDLAYGTGVWMGCVSERSVAALKPVLSDGREHRS